jgi:hypothetical protein
MTLPNISFTDYPLYAVESVMAADGSVMQIAAGLYPNTTQWLAYGWYIKNVQATPQNYEWVLNASKPEMAAGTPVSLSISLIQDRWQYRIEDLTTRAATAGNYPINVPPAFKVGDQELFAFESYSTSNIVFAQMGNLTLNMLRINGRQIATGWYEYGGWNTRHNPLFVVGAFDPPPYIFLQKTKDSTLIWSYEEWSGSQQEALPPPSLLTSLVGVSVVATILVFAILWVTKRQIHR